MQNEIKQTQCKRLLEVLENGYEVSQITFEESEFKRNMIKVLDAYKDLSIGNLPARVFNLKKQGYNIESIRVPHENKYGKTYFCKYKLVKEFL